MDRRSDTSRPWRVILGLAVVVAALFVIDPFGVSDDEPTEVPHGPFVAILARDEAVDRTGVDAPVEPDEVLGAVVVPEESPEAVPTEDVADRAEDAPRRHERGLRVVAD